MAYPQTASINSRAPIPFGNDFFEGEMLILLRTQPMDPFYADFFQGRRRLFEIQVQGRFKQLPQGILYLGGAVPEKLRLSLITRALANGLLSIVGRLVSGLEYNMGEEQAGETTVKPYIVFPLWQAADQLIVTRRGEAPPTLGTRLAEDSAVRSQRRGAAGRNFRGWDLDTTYTFNFQNDMVVRLAVACYDPRDVFALHGWRM